MNEACLAATSPKSQRRCAKAMGDFGVKLDPEKMPEALKDGTVNEAADHPRRRPRAL